MKIRNIIIIMSILLMYIMTIAYKVHQIDQSEVKHRDHIEAMIKFEEFVRDSLR